MSRSLLDLNAVLRILGNIDLVAALADHLALAQVVHVQHPLPGLTLRLGHYLANLMMVLLGGKTSPCDKMIIR